MSAPRPAQQRVLFIDDDAEHLALVQRLVETNLPILVDLATSSAGAEGRLNEHCYDVVICDVSLAGELGTTICARLLEIDPEQPLLLLTNYDALETVKQEAARLNVPIFPKMEVSADGFLQLLRTLLAKRPCAADAVHASPARRGARPQRRPHPIRLTSPLIAAARMARR